MLDYSSSALLLCSISEFGGLILIYSQIIFRAWLKDSPAVVTTNSFDDHQQRTKAEVVYEAKKLTYITYI